MISLAEPLRTRRAPLRSQRPLREDIRSLLVDGEVKVVGKIPDKEERGSQILV